MSNHVGTVYILRGLPGCGKSTLAELLIKAHTGLIDPNKICCADDYHIIDGVYKWDPNKVAYAHDQCRSKFADAIAKNHSVIVVANTNTRESEFAYYRDLANKNNYYVQFVIVGEFSDSAIDQYTKQNSHNVPKEQIIRMRDRLRKSIYEA